MSLLQQSTPPKTQYVFPHSAACDCLATFRITTVSVVQPVNQVVIWDHIVETPEEAKLSFHNTSNKYPLLSQGRDLQGKLVALTLHWDVMPLTGILFLQQQGRYTMRLPSEYCPNNCIFEEVHEPTAQSASTCISTSSTI